jgi:hypothetical protein
MVEPEDEDLVLEIQQQLFDDNEEMLRSGSGKNKPEPWDFDHFRWRAERIVGRMRNHTFTMKPVK